MTRIFVAGFVLCVLTACVFLPYPTVVSRRETIQENPDCLAPDSVFPAKKTTKDKYQLILERLKKANPDYKKTPPLRFAEFIRDTECLFGEYRSFSRFPFNLQAAVQFVENKRPLIREIVRADVEASGHVRGKNVVNRRQGMMRLEELVKAKLQNYGYAVVNMMGRPGVGKSTIAGKIKKGFASLKPEEILVIPVDSFRNNDIVLVNLFIENRNLLGVPLKDLTDAEYELFFRLSKSLQFPLIRDSDKSFLDYYITAEEREHETGENMRDMRRRKLWSHIGSNPRLQRNIDTPFKLMTQDDYEEVLRIAREMRLSTDRIRKDQDKSFMDIYKQADNEEFLEEVRKKQPSQNIIKLFVVEGTYSYQGERIFDYETERLMEKYPGHLIRVMIELDEDIRYQRVKDRRRSDMEEMLILQPVFDAIFRGSVDIERDLSDIVIDNTESTDIFQIKETRSGIKVQFGIISETARATLAREIFEKESPPSIYILPPELFRGGRNYADLEFLIYYNFFIKGGKRISVAGTKEQIDRMKIFLKESLYGPDLDSVRDISPSLRKFLEETRNHFAVKNKTGGILSLEAYVDFCELEIGGKIRIEVKKEDEAVPVEIEHIRAGLFSMAEEGCEPEIVEVDYREPMETDYSLTNEQQIALQNAKNNTFAVTPMGSEDGFTPGGDYTNFIIWLEGFGIHVDPSPRSLIYLEKAGIDPDDIPYILLTHNHADHDSGLIRKILMKKRVKVLASRPVYESFLVKAKALIGEGFTVENWLDWIELKEEKTNIIELPNGNSAEIDIRHNMHSIPTIGFIVLYKGKRFGYSGDTLYDTKIIGDWFEAGRITKEQTDKLLWFFWDENGNPGVDLLFHEAGVPPIHTSINSLSGIPDAVYERMYLVHLSPAKLKDAKDSKKFKQPALFDTKVLVQADEKAEMEMLAKTLDNVSLLGHLSPGGKMEILRLSIVKTFNPGDPVIFEGYRGDAFYIILSGRAEVVTGGERVQDACGKEWLLGGKPVWTYYPKDSFGEVALMNDKPRTASVRAVSSLRVLEIRKEDFLNIIYTPLRDEDNENMRKIKYCIEEWIQRYSESLIYNISDVSLTQAAKQIEIRRYQKGETIIRQGEEANTAYIIMDGDVGVYRDGDKVAVLSYGDIFGEMALLESIKKEGVVVKRNADCIAERDVEVLVINRELLVQLLHLYPGLDRGLSYEYRRRLIPHGMQTASPHKYMVQRQERVTAPYQREEREGIKVAKRHFAPDELSGMTDEEKIVLFLNEIFSDTEFLAPDEFSEEFYNPPEYRENLIRLNRYLVQVFSSFQIQRFYHKFIEISVYNEHGKKKTIYRFVRIRKKNVYRWIKENEVEAVAELPIAPVNAFLINMESERYQGVKGTPENVKTLQAYLETYNPETNICLIDCQWPENSVDFIIERIRVECPEVICISSTFGCLKELERLMCAVRKMPYKPLIVAGGLTATWSCEYLLEKFPEILCVQREGEEALSAVVKLVYENGTVEGKMENAGLLESVPNLIYVEKGNVKTNPVKKVELSVTPHPSRRTQLTRMKNAGFLLNSEGVKRGCGYGHCAFCTRTHGKARPLPVTRAAGDFEEYMRGGAGFIVYADEDFLPDEPGELDEFISRIEALKEKHRNDYFLENGVEPVDVSFYIATRTRCIWRQDDPEGNKKREKMLLRLKHAGLVKIFLGVESGSPVQLKKTYNKEASLLEMDTAIKTVRSLGIQVVAGFITFDPVVTLGQLRDNIRFVREAGLVKADALTEPINPFKQYRAQAGSPLVRKYTGIGLIASDHNPDTLMHDTVYRSKPVNLLMNMGQIWDEMISQFEYALKGIVWHAEQSHEEAVRAQEFIELFNWFRERGYLLLEDLCNVLAESVTDRNAGIDKFFDRLNGLSSEKILFELKRAVFPHTDIYGLIERYIREKGLNGEQAVEFLKSFFKGSYPDNLVIEEQMNVFSGWIEDIAQDLSLQVMTEEEVSAARKRLNEIFRKALMERISRLHAFRDSDWRIYYSGGADLVERGIEFNHLLEDVINRHKDMILRIAESGGFVSYEENPRFRIYHRISLKKYFQYRHPDISEPLSVLYRLKCILSAQKKTANPENIFLYPDGTIKCEDLRDASEAEIIDLVYEGLKQIYISSYNPFSDKDNISQSIFESVLCEMPACLEPSTDNILRSLYKEYAVYYKIDIERGGYIEYTNATIEPSCNIEIRLKDKKLYSVDIHLKGCDNVPSRFRWIIPEDVYTPAEDGMPVITKGFSEYAADVIRQLLRGEADDEEYRKNITVVNAVIETMRRFKIEKDIDWLSPICDIVDETVRPLTIYLPDTDAGMDIAERTGSIPVIFLNKTLYKRLWPGIMPHINDIILFATPGILDDFSKVLEMVREGVLRPDLVQLIYEVFHNRVNPDAFMRNKNFKEVIKYTTNSMRIMPRRTPVLLLNSNSPLSGKYVSDKPLNYMTDSKGRLRLLLHPYTYKKWVESGVAFPRPDTEVEWVLTYPTASHRTLFVLGRKGNRSLIGKVHSTIWAGPAVRRLKPDAVDHSFRVSERLRKPVDQGRLPDSIKDKFGYFIEQGYTFMDRVLYPEGIGVLYRSTYPYPYAKDRGKRFLMPTFSAHNNAANVPENVSETPLTQLIDWNIKDTGRDPVDYFIDEILKPLYDIYFYYMFEQGFLLEPHGQNFFFEIDRDGRICRLVFKDWQSTMVDMGLRERLGLSKGQSIIKHLFGIEAEESTSLSIVFDHYWGTYLMRQLLEVLVNRYHGEKERNLYRQLLLKRFKDVFEGEFCRYPSAKNEFPDISLRHGKKPPEDMTNRVWFAASGAPMMRHTGYERVIGRLAKNPRERKGKVVVPVTKIDDENAVIQRQDDLPDNMTIDFDRTRIEDNCIVVYPKGYDPHKKYSLLLALHGKGSHPARLIDVPDKIGSENVITVIPKAPFKFGTGYTWFDEEEKESETKNRSAEFIAGIVRDFNARGIVDNTYMFGVSEGGYMAHMFGMRYPKLIKGLITFNAPFRENYFTEEDLSRVKKDGFPDVFILQYDKDKIVAPANSQRAELFYKTKGIEPKTQYYSTGSHHRISIEAGEDINRWIRILENERVGERPLGREDVLMLFKDAETTVGMVERVMPLLISLLPQDTAESSQILRERFGVITSSLCYCLFQVRLKMKDPMTKTDTFLLDTVKWLGKETKSLLEELMELETTGPESGGDDISLRQEIGDMPKGRPEPVSGCQTDRGILTAA